MLCFSTFTIEIGKVRGLEHQKGGCKEGFLVRSSIPGKNKRLEKQKVRIMERGGSSWSSVSCIGTNAKGCPGTLAGGT